MTHHSIKVSTLSVALMLCATFASAQDFMLQGFYWNYPSRLGGGTKFFAQDLIEKMPDLKKAGFNYLWLPPLSRASNDQASTGYDVKDYYDLGEYGGGATRFGSRKLVRKVIDSARANGMATVADLIFNHRTGGDPEDNVAVKGWVENYNLSKHNSGDQVFPSDRFRCYIVLGDSFKGGTYYVKIKSASQSSDFYNKPYTVLMWTGKTPIAQDTLLDGYEYEPNNGGDCGDTSNSYTLGYRKFCNLDNGGCGIDEFRLRLDTSMYTATGDTLFISIGNTNAKNLGDFSDQYIKSIYYDSLRRNIKAEIHYQTLTDFTHMPSGKGAMSKANFKPNGRATQLSGDWDQMLFFYDIDQYVPSTVSVCQDFTNWMFDSVNIGGIRLDAVKNYPYSFVDSILNNLNAHGHNPGMVVGEFYDYNPSALIGWTQNVKNGLTQATKDSVNVRVFDFALRGALKAACDQFGYDVRGVFSAGMVDGGGGSGKNAVTFVGNHDFRDPGQPVQYNPELVYAYILTNNKIGVPCVYYPDYFGSNFMRGRIKGLMQAHRKYIYQSNIIDYLSAGAGYPNFYVKGFATTTLTYQLQNAITSKPVVVSINFAGDTLDVYQKVNMNTLAVGDTFTDIFNIGTKQYTTITPNQELHIKIPPRSFAVFVRGTIIDSTNTLGDTLAPAVIKPNAIEEVVSTKPFATVYPNPFSGKLMVTLTGAKDEEISTEIVDLTGRVIASDRATTHRQSLVIDTAISVPGIYYIRLSTATETMSYKIIRE